MPRLSGCPKKSQVYGAVTGKPNPKTTYALAHSARCKLMMSADSPDRNLRMVLGHAFALDNLLVRIVEIENDAAANELDDLKKTDSNPTVNQSEITTQDQKTAGIGGGAGVTVGETGDLSRPKQTQQKERRISFGNSANFRPSDYAGNDSTSSGKRDKSPPPAKRIPKGYSDEESTSSDDYDDVEDVAQMARPQAPPSAMRDSTTFDDVPAQDPYEEQDEGPGLGLTRFQSASARGPRKAPSPPPEDEPPALDADDSDEEIEDRPEPPSPPQLPDEMVRNAIEHGTKDEDLGDMYESLRGCPCCKQHANAPKTKGVWRVDAGEGGKQYAVIAEERDQMVAA